MTNNVPPDDAYTAGPLGLDHHVDLPPLTVDQYLPAGRNVWPGVTHDRSRHRPSATARLPLASESPTWPPGPRQALSWKNDVSPSGQPSSAAPRYDPPLRCL